MTDSNLKHLARMREQIEAFKRTEIGLKSLVGDLLFLRDSLSDVDKDWEFEFTQRVADLDSAYSYALEKNNGKLESISQKLVDESIPRILGLIEE